MSASDIIVATTPSVDGDVDMEGVDSSTVSTTTATTAAPRKGRKIRRIKQAVAKAHCESSLIAFVEVLADKDVIDFLRKKSLAKQTEILKTTNEAINGTAVKDPEMPKFPTNAFQRFAKAMRSEIMDKYKTKNNIEITKYTSECWKTLAAEDRKVYELSYQAEKAEYDIRMGEYKKRKAEEVTAEDGEDGDVSTTGAAESEIVTKKPAKKRKTKAEKEAEKAAAATDATATVDTATATATATAEEKKEAPKTKTIPKPRGPAKGRAATAPPKKTGTGGKKAVAIPAATTTTAPVDEIKVKIEPGLEAEPVKAPVASKKPTFGGKAPVTTTATTTADVAATTVTDAAMPPLETTTTTAAAAAVKKVPAKRPAAVKKPAGTTAATKTIPKKPIIKDEDDEDMGNASDA
jgi:hypothetical protein